MSTEFLRQPIEKIREVQNKLVAEQVELCGRGHDVGAWSLAHLRRARRRVCSQRSLWSDCGCAGIFNAPHALESYVTVFDEEGALDRFEAFASENGPRFYGLPLNEGTVTLEKVAQEVPASVAGGAAEIVPFHAGETISWRLAS